MPLQKSFSDANHSGKENNNSRPKWGLKSYQNQQQKSKVPSKPLAEKPPIPLSNTTKNILNNFQYRDQGGKKDDSKDVANMASPEADSRNTTPLRKRRRSSTKDGMNSAKDAPVEELALADEPSTPSTGFDPTQNDDLKRPLKLVSPDDRIIWDTNKDSQMLPYPPSGNLRKRKRGDGEANRAQSSSPIQGCSSQADPLPKPGPEVDMWMRLAQKDNKLSRIMDNASPRSSKEGNTPRGLTRSRSLGNPLNPKRHQPNSIRKNRDIDTTGLMRRLQEDYKPKNISSGPSSSSPLPDKVQFPDEGPSSPLEKKGTEKRTSPLKRRLEPPSSPIRNAESAAFPPSPKRPSTSESDYGSDDGLDELGGMILTAIESQSQAPPAASLSRPLPPPQKYESPSKPKAYSTHKPPNLSKYPSTLKAADDDSDEFGEGLDDDDFDAAFAGSVPADDVELPPSKPRGAAVKEESDDEYGDDIDDSDFAAAEIAATQSLKQSATSLMPSMEKVRAIQRYLVTMIDDNQYEGFNGELQPEKILYLQPDRSKSKRVVYLRGTWIDTPVNTKAFVHIIGKFDSHGICIIDDNSGLIILHPDHLISALVVADSFGCTRRAVLQDRVKVTGEASPSMLYGTILHEIFQAAMLANRWDTMFLSELINKLAQRHLEDLYVIKVQMPQAVEYLHSKMGELQSWAELFVSSQPKSGALVKAGNGDTVAMCVSNLLDVEEHVWSPMYGLKGNIDATVQITMRDGKEQRTLTAPLEVKTGKNPSVANRAQTALYNLLISDRYDVEIAYGILYYMETSETIRIPAIRHELRHMIMQRNELACFVREKTPQLPPMLKKESMCGRCYAKNTCFIYHKLADDGNGETSGMKEKFDEVVKHLTPRHKEFFLKWDDLLTKEEKDSLKFRRELWTMLSSEREKLGRCFSNVIIEPGSAYEDQNNEKINRYRYTMIKPAPAPGFSFMDSQIIVGDPIVISDEKGHFALAKGYVTNVRKNRITVAVDRRLHNARIRQPGFDETNNQVFASIMEVAADGSTPVDSIGKIVEDPILYRLDKDEFSNGLANVRNNLIQIMTEGPFGSREIRGLVVDLNAPRFKPHSSQYTLKDRSSINVDQRRAIEKVMSAQDYALVLGMPGTGKTTTIAHIIRALVSQGKSVLLTSYTHTAVDNILLKLRDDSIPILRLGNKAKIHPDVQEFAKLAVDPKETMEDIRSVWHDTPIIATSCLGINHPIFNERTFDYCIVDEASQITLPVCVGPIRLARTFILVGDHNQLPPLVKDEEARKGGLDISLFKYLSDSHPQSVVYLEHQYRMNADVMALSNILIYNGRLKCGSDSVASRRIIIPEMDALKAHHHTPSSILHSTQKYICLEPKRGRCWLRDLLDPDVTVAFVDTDGLGDVARESEKGNRTVNDVEVKIVTQLVTSLISTGVDPNEIGVMTHYRSQLALLKDGLRSAKGVEMHTADRFQGRDKEVIVLSLVRSNEAGNIGELLKDWRRINVAFTRAKTKLLVIGSRGTLKGSGERGDDDKPEEMVSRFVKLMEEKKWVYELSMDQFLGHYWEMAVSQSQSSMTGVSSQWLKVENDAMRAEKRKIANVFMDIEGYGNDKENFGGGGRSVKKDGRVSKSGKQKHQPKRIRGGLAANDGNVKLGSVLMDLVNDGL
ncbi:hypothetical protein DSL72_004897 [Monilinia vaccinii-corymbosi]|uniref:DNA replication ATP-dependent helicase/nuclease n=1 Tax=Monilinia vaccinii-corymbosi TaxID=61207 RepID=A0A8A3P397_9HELO|nr:hypothetical protein DSL72_004897 [Monilinia vaccinii-corymbosi]